MVCWFCCYKGSGQKVRPSRSKCSEEEVVWRAFTIFMLSGKIARAVILIGWKYATTITVKLIYAPNKNKKFFLLQEYYISCFVIRHIVVCRVTLRRKETTGMWTRILMSFNSFNDSPCTVSGTNRRKQLRMLEQELSIQPEVSRSSWSRRNE